MIHANWRRRALLFSIPLAGLLMPTAAVAAQPVNEFRDAGAGLACIAEAAPTGFIPNQDLGYLISQLAARSPA